MIDTELKANTENLCRLVKEIATPATLEMIASQLDDCPASERLELVMEAYFTFEQKYMIVVINKTNTYGLIKDALNSDRDVVEYIDLSNAGTIKHWHE